MKKLKKLLVAVPLALASAAALTGCGDPHEHSLKLTGAIAPDCDSAGNSAYYTCETCGKYYSDDQGDTEIEQNSWVLNPLGHLYMNAEDHDCNRGCGTIRETSAYNVWDGTASNSLPEAVNGVIGITTAEQLAKVAAMVNAGETFEGVTLKLYSNIDLDGRAWTPIGHSYRKTADAKKFMGTFDGNGHKIMNLTNAGYTPTDTLEETDEFDVYVYGLFGYVENATIKNLTVEVNIDANDTALKGDCVAGIVGYANGGLTMDNCTVNGTIDGGFDAVGGLVGRAYNSTTANKVMITNCTNNAKITSIYKSAGIVGYIQAKDEYILIDGCTNTGDIVVTGVLDTDYYVSFAAGIVNYAWSVNATTDHTVIITNNINIGNIYSVEEIDAGLGDDNNHSFAGVASSTGWPQYMATNPHYDFRGNTNNGKVFFNGTEVAALIVTPDQEVYDVSYELNDTTNMAD